MANPFSDTKTLIAFAERAHQFGLSVRQLQQAIDHPCVLRRIVEYIKAGAPPVQMLGPAYNASDVLAIGSLMQGSLPQVQDGEVAIWYGGWSLQQLCENRLVQERDLICNQDWYYEESWFKETLPVGFYRLKIPVSRSCNKLFDEQIAKLTTVERVAHPLLLATAWICHKIQTGKDLFNNKWIRTSKRVVDEDCDEHVELHCNGRQLHIDAWDDEQRHDVYIATEITQV